MPTALQEPVTTARPRGSVTLRTSAARAPPAIRAEQVERSFGQISHLPVLLVYGDGCLLVRTRSSGAVPRDRVEKDALIANAAVGVCGGSSGRASRLSSMRGDGRRKGHGPCLAQCS